MQVKRVLPDIIYNDTSNVKLPLQWVGMERISVPIFISNKKIKIQRVNAMADVYVNLIDKKAKGIHMSRLHLALSQQLGEDEIGMQNICSLLEKIIKDQDNFSDSAKVVLNFELVIEKNALISEQKAFQSYPIQIQAENIKGEITLRFGLTIPYSSTCPCSASLAKQLYSEELNNRFLSDTINKKELLQWVTSQAGSIATPHSQRSYAYIQFTCINTYWPDLNTLILSIEELIGTPVQTAVKREDEQEFARLNAENLMFCEDAARRIKSGLENIREIKDYWFKVEHQESLHAHNAVVVDQKTIQH